MATLTEVSSAVFNASQMQGRLLYFSKVTLDQYKPLSFVCSDVQIYHVDSLIGVFHFFVRSSFLGIVHNWSRPDIFLV